MDFNPLLNDFTTKLIAGTVLGISSILGLRIGVDYMMTRGNPRARAQAHESAADWVKGALIIGGIGIGVITVALGSLGVH